MMRNRYDSLLRAIVVLMRCSEEDAKEAIRQCRTGRLVKSANLAVLSESLGNNIESVMDELSRKRKYGALAREITVDMICHVVYEICEEDYLDELAYRNRLIGGYTAEAMPRDLITRYNSRLRAKSKKRLIELYSRD